MEHGIMVLDEDMEESALMSNSSQNFDSLSGSWIQSTPQVNLVHAFNTLPALGLKLSETPSFLYKLDQLARGQNCNVGKQTNPNSDYTTGRAKLQDTLQQANKMKAENFPISLLRIGSWQRVSRNEGDLVAKSYFAKRKLVWEFLENCLKSKIEIQWSDILSLKAIMQEDQPGILEIELNQPPSFYHEIDPQPRKHTQWRMVSDFTGGQALSFRRHYLEFPVGALDKPFEKLLRCDSRLFQLSRQNYPTLESPHFQKHTFGIDLSFDFGTQGHVNAEQQLSFSNVPTYFSQHFQTYAQNAQKSLHLKNPNSSISDEHISNPMPPWGQGMNNVTDNLITNQVGGMSFAATSALQVNSTISFQNSYASDYVQEGMKNQFGGLATTSLTSQMHSTQMFLQEDDLQNMLLNNSQIEFSSEMAAGNLSREGYFTNNTNNVTPNYGQNMIDNIVVMNNNLSSSRLISSQAASWSQSQSQSQVLHENMSANLLPNNSFCSYVNYDQTMEHFLNFNNEINDGT